MKILTRIIHIVIALFMVSCGSKPITDQSQIADTTQLYSADGINLPKVETKSDSVLKPEKYEGKNLSDIGNELLRTETLGEIRMDLSSDQVIKILGEPDKKTEPELWGADGLTHRTWSYKMKGLEFDLSGSAEKELKIETITAKAGCNFKTKKNIGIGSIYNDVKNIYVNAMDKETSDGTKLVLGSIYGGIIFNFQANKVESIFFGASAE